MTWPLSLGFAALRFYLLNTHVGDQASRTQVFGRHTQAIPKPQHILLLQPYSAGPTSHHEAGCDFPRDRTPGGRGTGSYFEGLQAETRLLSYASLCELHQHDKMAAVLSDEV